MKNLTLKSLPDLINLEKVVLWTLNLIANFTWLEYFSIKLLFSSYNPKGLMLFLLILIF